MKLVVVNCVGLTRRHLGAETPHLSALAAEGFATPMTGVIPAVTTSAQTTMLTGVLPQSHGIVGNGWYFRELGEVWLWRQSQRLVQAPHLWEGTALKVLKHFWWYAMNTDVAASVTPRPAYHQDGAKSPDIYTLPSRLKNMLRDTHGEFPLFNFWGPTADIRSTRWIAESFATAWDEVRPDLALCYLPHLDYDLQRLGPHGPHLAHNLRELDEEAGKVIGFARARGAAVAVVSEYGIEAVDRAVCPNRILREAGLLATVRNATGELLDPGASRAFAVVDHQLAHVYVRDPADVPEAQAALARAFGIERIVGGSARADLGLDHARSGELVILAAPGCWFAHDWWLTATDAPDFARCVEIHKKPGYDPRELFFEPKGGTWRAARALLRKKIGLRYVMDAITGDTSLVRGSHGRPPANPEDGPVFIASERTWLRDTLAMTNLAPLFRSYCLQ
jgi:predicted AlkP superfamily pyrophosphatase or phosphodiesterase